MRTIAAKDSIEDINWEDIPAGKNKLNTESEVKAARKLVAENLEDMKKIVE